MKLAIAAACGTLGLCACVSLPQRDSLDKPASITHESKKAPRVVADCIALEWKKTRVVGSELAVDVQPQGAGLRVTMKVGGAPSRVAQVDPQGSGSGTQLWNLSMDFGATAPAVLAVRDCQ